MKRALIMSGGGAKGAFTVGALTEMNRRGINSFDLISGSSTGALISGLLAAGKLQKLRNIYRTVSNSDIVKPQNIIRNLFGNKPYLLDSAPLEDMIETNVTQSVYDSVRNSNTILCLTAVNLQTARPTVFSSKQMNETATFDTVTIRNHGHFKHALLASSNQAVFLPPVEIAVNNVDYQFVDGGNREVVPTAVVREYMKDFENEGPNEIYVISNNPFDITPGKQKYTSFIDVLFRAISMFLQDVRENDLKLIRDYCQQSGTKLITIEPAVDLDPDFPTGLRFDRVLMSGWMNDGEQKAGQVLDMLV